MSIFATVAIVCTMSICNDHGIDTADTFSDGAYNTLQHTSEYQKVWEDEKGLTNWLKKYKIDESIFEIVSIDIETHEIKHEDIP